MLEGYLANQRERNELISAENAKLDVQIKEIASLRQEIEALRSRQKAVAGPAVGPQPAGLPARRAHAADARGHLPQVRQAGRPQGERLPGWAASNERVSEFLRNLQNNGRYVERPELIEIKLAAGSPQGIQRRLFEFSLNFTMKQNPDRPAAVAAGKPPAGGAPAPKKS